MLTAALRRSGRESCRARDRVGSAGAPGVDHAFRTRQSGRPRGRLRRRFTASSGWSMIKLAAPRRYRRGQDRSAADIDCGHGRSRIHGRPARQLAARLFPEVASELGVGWLPVFLAAPLRRARDLSLRFAESNVVIGERMRAKVESRASLRRECRSSGIGRNPDFHAQAGSLERAASIVGVERPFRRRLLRQPRTRARIPDAASAPRSCWRTTATSCS